jgi:hypothetical protein
MKVIGVVEYGGPEALRIFEVPEPHAGPGQVRIRVAAATVNPTDTAIRNGARADAQKEFSPPYVPGMEAAGLLDEIGEGVVTDLSIGEQVMAIVVPRGSHGAYAEHVVVPVESVTRTPAGSSLVEAATLPMNGLTARLALDLLGTPTQDREEGAACRVLASRSPADADRGEGVSGNHFGAEVGARRQWGQPKLPVPADTSFRGNTSASGQDGGHRAPADHPGHVVGRERDVARCGLHRRGHDVGNVTRMGDDPHALVARR